MDQYAINVGKFKVRDIHLNVAQIGKGEPLVFIHGWSNNWIGWKLLAHELAPHYRLHLIDLPGFGDSDRLEEYSLEILSHYIHDYIKEYAPTAKALIGGSMGTFLLAETITKFDLDLKVVMIGTFFKKNNIGLLVDLYKQVLVFSSSSPSAQFIFEFIVRHPYSAYFVEKYLNSYEFNKQLVDTYQVPGRRKVNGKSYVQIGASMMNYKIEDLLKQINSETLLIFGSSDRYTSPKLAGSMVTKLNKKNITNVFVDKAGHCPAYEQPKKTAELILKFLD